MSTTMRYHLFGLRDCTFTKFTLAAGAGVFAATVNDTPPQRCCPPCGSRKVIRKGPKTRRLKSVPVGSRETFIDVTMPRRYCHACHRCTFLQPSAVDKGCAYTQPLIRYALGLLRSMNLNDVAHHLNVSWTWGKNIPKDYLQKHYGKPKLAGARYWGIDEVAVASGHRYLTTVLDLETGAILFVGEGKGSEGRRPFWKRLRRSGAKIKAVATDLAPAYLALLPQVLPQAAHVFAPFQVVKLRNDKLSQLRRELFHELKDVQPRKVLKGTRGLLRKNPEPLDADKNEPERLPEALKLNEPLTKAYYLKEELRQIWAPKNKSAAKAILKRWLAAAEASEVRLLREMGATLSRYRTGILNGYDYPITTAAVEGTNHKIGAIRRASYGLRDLEFLKLKIYAGKNVRDSLVG